MSKKLTDKPGCVVTFYSYKGGVGRTMALANISVKLAQWGYKVLVIDWDLEAPGLENFFKDGLSLTDSRKKQGLIDILASKITGTGTAVHWSSCIVPICITKTEFDINTTDKLDIITSGNFDENYYTRVRSFDFNDFYENNNGGMVIETLRKEWKDAYDFIFIDSRTGVTDIGGVCTIQLPDILALLFTPTEHGFNGILKVAEKAFASQRKLPFERLNMLALPVPTRMDSTETDLHINWLKRFESGLTGIYKPWLSESVSRLDFLTNTKIPYIPYFSFGEGLPIAKEGSKDPARMGYAYESLAALLATRLNYAKLLLHNRTELIKAAIDPEAKIEDVNKDDLLKNKEDEIGDLQSKINQGRKLFKKIAIYTVGVLLVAGPVIYFFYSRAQTQKRIEQAKNDSLAKLYSQYKNQIDSLRKAGGLLSDSVEMPSGYSGIALKRANNELASSRKPRDTSNYLFASKYFGAVNKNVPNVNWPTAFVVWCFVDDDRELQHRLAFMRTDGINNLLDNLKKQGMHLRYRNTNGVGKFQKGPKAGDIIFYDFQEQKGLQACGIVLKHDGEFVYSIEGNELDRTIKIEKRYLQDALAFCTVQ